MHARTAHMWRESHAHARSCTHCHAHFHLPISYHIPDSYSESACAVRGWWSLGGACDVSSACAACGHVDSVDSVEGRILEIRNVLDEEMDGISRKSVVRIRCRNPNRATKLVHSSAPKMWLSYTNANLPYRINSLDQPTRDCTFQPAHVFEMHLSARASVLGRNPALAGPSTSPPLRLSDPHLIV